jgi:FkbM family methyltransferase
MPVFDQPSDATMAAAPARGVDPGVFVLPADKEPLVIDAAAEPDLQATLAPVTALPLLPATPLHPAQRAMVEAQVRARAQGCYLGDHTALCRVMGRYKVYVDTRDIGLASHLLLDGYWEMWVTEALSGLVRPGMVVADIGANVGYFSLLMGDWTGPHGQVLAFEPNPRLHTLLTRTLAVNGMRHARAHGIALADRAGEALLIVPDGEPKNGHLAPAPAPAPTTATATATATHDAHAVRVATHRLDQEQAWADIELAKIDVEGAEERIWAGMAGLLARRTLRTVVLEFTPARYRDPAAFLRALIAPGFDLARIDVFDGIVDCSPDQVLAGPAHEDVMLVLRR